MATPLPVPPLAQIRDIRAKVAEYRTEFDQCIANGNEYGATVALNELDVCQKWLRTYVTHRADGEVIFE